MTKKDFTLLVALLLLLMMLMLSGCGVNYNLRRAAYHTKRAIAKGAKVHVDTTWTTIPIISPEIKFVTTTQPVFFKDTIFIRDEKTGIEVKAKVNVDTTSAEPKGTLSLEVKKPAQTSKKKIPIAIDTTIKSPRGFWYYLGWMAGCLIVGFILGAVFWASVRAWIKGMI